MSHFKQYIIYFLLIFLLIFYEIIVVRNTEILNNVTKLVYFINKNKHLQRFYGLKKKNTINIVDIFINLR